MEPVMEKIKEILKRRMHFLHYYASPENYFNLECEYIDFVFETPELTEVMRRIVRKGKIPREQLEAMFAVYIVINSNGISEEFLPLPNFYCADIEQETHLLECVRQNFIDDLESHKSNANPLNTESIKETLRKSYSYGNITALKKLNLDILQEIDLLDTAIYQKTEANPALGNFSFDAESGVLTFAQKTIPLKKGAKSTRSVLLMRTLVKAEDDEYLERGEILDDWGLTSDDREETGRNIIFNAGKAINESIIRQTGIADFLEYSTLKARINPRYRREK